MIEMIVGIFYKPVTIKLCLFRICDISFFILWLTKIYTLDLKIATKCSVAVYGLSWLYSVFHFFLNAQMILLFASVNTATLPFLS